MNTEEIYGILSVHLSYTDILFQLGFGKAKDVNSRLNFLVRVAMVLPVTLDIVKRCDHSDICYPIQSKFILPPKPFPFHYGDRTSPFSSVHLFEI